MKRILLAAALALAAGGQALAADLPQPGPPPPRAPATYVPVPAPVFTWTGIYVGANGGYAFGDSNWSPPGFTPTGNFSTSGYLPAGTLGGNNHWGQFVLGIEGDGDWTDLSGSVTCTRGFTCTTSSDWLATVRGRAGYAFDRILIYGTGGGAFGNVKAYNSATGGTDTNTEYGWTAGAGVEFAFTPNLTGKVEYLYVDLANGACSASCPGFGGPVAVSFTENVVRAGINYKFW